MTTADVASTPPRIAITHDYLTQYGGAERVLEAMHMLWPDAPIFTTIFHASKLRAMGFTIPEASVHALLPSWLPHGGVVGKLWTFVFPIIWRFLDLSAYSLVVSSSSFAAHHVRVSNGARHICYCHSPPRFLYGLTTELNHARLHRVLPFLRRLYAYLRDIDRAAAAKVTCFVANSEEVRRRIALVYGRDSMVIYPPVDTVSFGRQPLEPGTYFLSYGRLVGSKHVDIAIRAAKAAQVPLLIAGTGADEPRLRHLAGATTTFVGRPSDAQLLALIARCTAVVFTAEEDFGMVPVEAMAAGKPVIALARGGALETVEQGITGEFYDDRDPSSLTDVLRSFDPSRYTAGRCRARAAAFDRAVFLNRMSLIAASADCAEHCT